MNRWFILATVLLAFASNLIADDATDNRTLFSTILVRNTGPTTEEKLIGTWEEIYYFALTLGHPFSVEGISDSPSEPWAFYRFMDKNRGAMSESLNVDDFPYPFVWSASKGRLSVVFPEYRIIYKVSFIDDNMMALFVQYTDDDVAFFGIFRRVKEERLRTLEKEVGE